MSLQQFLLDPNGRRDNQFPIILQPSAIIQSSGTVIIYSIAKTIINIRPYVAVIRYLLRPGIHLSSINKG